MAKNPRTESLPNLDGDTFKVGDGVHWGFNGDAYPGTVVRVSASGRKVYVSHDKYRVVPRPDGQSQAYSEGPKNCEFETVEVPDAALDVYTLRKSGHFHQKGYSKGYAWSLRPGREFAQNPHF
jgi:hypothetical protein